LNVENFFKNGSKRFEKGICFQFFLDFHCTLLGIKASPFGSFGNGEGSEDPFIPLLGMDLV